MVLASRLSLAALVAGLAAARAEEPRPPLAPLPPFAPLPANVLRLTSFGERADWVGDGKRLDPVVSPDGGTFAFQEARSHEPAGVGHGILILLPGE